MKISRKIKDIIILSVILFPIIFMIEFIGIQTVKERHSAIIYEISEDLLSESEKIQDDNTKLKFKSFS